MAEVLYVRNGRPNRVILKLNGIKYLLERRGTREDTAALPIEAETDPIVARFIRAGYLERIDKTAFMELAARLDGDAATRLENELPVKTITAKEVAVPMAAPDSPTPTIIADKDLAASVKVRSPRLDHEKFVSTNVELGFEKSEEVVAEDDEKEQLKNELELLKAQIALLTEKAAEKETEKPKTRKRASSTAKSTRARSAQKS